MCKVITVALQKGGSGKTSTAVNLAACLGASGYKVLLVDLDAQANATFSSGADPRSLASSIYNVLTHDNKLRRSVGETILKMKHYDLLPADRDAADLTEERIGVNALKAVLQQIKKDYDFIVIDTPPDLDAVTVNAFVASDYLIIPSEAKPFCFMGLSDLKETLDELKNAHAIDLTVVGILLVKHSQRTRLSKTMTQLIKQYSEALNTSVFETSIRESVAVPESQGDMQTVIDYAPKANPTLDYMEFTKEVIERIGG